MELAGLMVEELLIIIAHPLTARHERLEHIILACNLYALRALIVGMGNDFGDPVPPMTLASTWQYCILLQQLDRSSPALAVPLMSAPTLADSPEKEEESDDDAKPEQSCLHLDEELDSAAHALAVLPMSKPTPTDSSDKEEDSDDDDEPEQDATNIVCHAALVVPPAISKHALAAVRDQSVFGISLTAPSDDPCAATSVSAGTTFCATPWQTMPNHNPSTKPNPLAPDSASTTTTSPLSLPLHTLCSPCLFPLPLPCFFRRFPRPSFWPPRMGIG